VVYAFAEYAVEPNPETKDKDAVALSDGRPPIAFVGIWIEFKGDRSTKFETDSGLHMVCGFLTRDCGTDASESNTDDPDHRGRARRVKLKILSICW
jgi:hypothetical protein